MKPDPSVDPYILRSQIQLYGYIGTINDSQGVLEVTLQISPTVLLQWNFTCTEEQVAKRNLSAEVSGLNFRIPNQRIAPTSLRTGGGIHFWQYTGRAFYAEQGVPPASINELLVYLPVARFHEANLLGETLISSHDFARDAGSEERKLGSSRSQGKVLSITLDSFWSISFYTSQVALSWLRGDNQPATGTLLTTEMRLYHTDPNSPVGLSLSEFDKKLEHILFLLSFVNGGSVGKVIVVCRDTEKNISNEYTRYYSPLVSPIEQLGNSWQTHNSDLGAYLRCCGSLEIMMQAPFWQDALPVIIDWYFQAIQPSYGGTHKPWQIIANSVVAALERLCNTLILETSLIESNYLKKELRRTKDFSLKHRILAVFEHIGLRNVDGYHLDNSVETLIKIRNDATHNKQLTTLKVNKRYDVLFLAVQWLEEMLLWRLGYSGRHRIQLALGDQFQHTKYDLTARSQSW